MIHISTSALGIVLCLSLPSRTQTQGTTAGDQTLRASARKSDMTQPTTADVQSGATALRASAADTAIRPFKVHVPESALADLRRRIAATRWPDK